MTDTLRDLLRFTDEQKQELRRRMMTDTLRDRIVRVQAEHVEGQLTNYDTGREECGCGRQDSATYREHLADAILALPGITIMELPEPDYGPDGEGQFGWSANGADITATPDLDGHWSVWDSDCQLEPHDARDLAAALLAAAEYAEKETK